MQEQYGQTVDITNGQTLSRAVKDKNTPLRRYLEAKFPNARPLQLEYKSTSGELVVDTLGAPTSTVGTAVDLLIRFLLDPDDVPQSARIVFRFDLSYRWVVKRLSRIAGLSINGGYSEEQSARALWALALCVEAYRTGPRHAPLVYRLMKRKKFDVQTMLSQASPKAVRELLALKAVAKQNLLPHLEQPFYLGPEFDGSKRRGLWDKRLIAAEADLICHGLLIDVKTQLGVKNSAGVRKDTLSTEHLYQLLAYALLDYSNTYGIDRLGLYSARYGRLIQWPLEYVTSTMAGQPVDFRAARQDVWNALHR